MNLDTWSDNLIKDSFMGKIVGACRDKPLLDCADWHKQLSVIGSIILQFLIYALFTSLILPQFSDDRFGVGIIILFCIFFFLLTVMFMPTYKVTFNFLDFLVFILLFILIISTFSSYFFRESASGLLKYILFFSWYFIARMSLLNFPSKALNNFWLFIFFLAVIVSLIGIYQYCVGVEPLATWEDPESEDIHTRVYSTLGNPNLLGGYLLLVLPIGIGLLFSPVAGCSVGTYCSKPLQVCGIILIFLCLIFTGSRGAYLGLFFLVLISGFVLGTYFFKKEPKINKKRLLITLILVLAGIGLLTLYLFPMIQERLLTIFTLREHSSNNYRVNVWLSSLKMLKDNWLFGIGPGNSTFKEAYGVYMVSGFDALASYNIFLDIAVEGGIFALVPFVLIILVSFLKLHRLFWVNGSFFSFWLFLALSAILVHGMVDTVFFRPQIFILFWFLLASIGKLEDEYTTKDERSHIEA